MVGLLFLAQALSAKLPHHGFFLRFKQFLRVMDVVKILFLYRSWWFVGL